MKFYIVFLLILQFFVTPLYAQAIVDLDQEEAMRIGIKIWHNECAGQIRGLTSWNEGEKFASLGIGHFIWSPDRHIGSNEEGFPQLIKYMENNGITVPTWLQGDSVPPCPWSTRENFHAAMDSEKMQELRQFLVATMPVQAQFMVHRLVNSFIKIMSKASYEEQQFINEQFYILSSSPKGMYMLVDYVNFKGEGTGWFAKRKNGWGLLQVFKGMRSAPTNYNVMQSFVWSANICLTERVRNSPPGSNEERWLPGWRKRLMTYLE